MAKSPLILALLCSVLPPAAGQTPPLRATAATPFLRSDTSLVLVPVTVTDRNGAIINGLDPARFTVFEDKIPQTIVAFSTEDAPSSIGIVFDMSGSMRNRMNLAKAALRELAANANPEDEAFLITVRSRPQIASSFTADLGALVNTVQFAQAEGSTAFIDGVYEGLERMRPASHTRRALLVLSDGMDNHSRHSKAELLRRAEESDVQIYTVAMDARVLSRKPIEQQEEQRGLALMQDLSDRTGGLHFTIRDEFDATRVIANAVRAMRSRYVLAYHPAQTDQSGKWHKIRVKLDVANTHVLARNGYYSP